MTCTFFGHKDTPYDIKDKLRETITKMIEEKGVTSFYVGNHGNFDKMVLSELKELSKQYPQIRYAVVLAYLTQHNDEDYSNTVYPEGIESVPKRFAIDFRNKWMVQQSDFVVTYIRRSIGGAAKFADIAKKRGKEVINIYCENCLKH